MLFFVFKRVLFLIYFEEFSQNTIKFFRFFEIRMMARIIDNDKFRIRNFFVENFADGEQVSVINRSDDNERRNGDFIEPFN